MHFRTPEQQFAAVMAATPQSTFPRRPIHQPAASWWPDVVDPEEHEDDFIDLCDVEMRREHGTHW